MFNEAFIYEVWKNLTLAGALWFIMWYFIKQNAEMQKRNNKTVQEGFEKIAKSIKGLEMSVGKSPMTETDDIIEMASKYVALASFPKIDFIEQRLLKNNIEEREEKIKVQIRNRLEELSMNLYIKPLNKYNTPVGLLGTWISDNFDMEEFIKEIYDIVFSKDDLEKKKIDIKTIMDFYQMDLWKELRIQLNNH